MGIEISNLQCVICNAELTETVTEFDVLFLHPSVTDYIVVPVRPQGSLSIHSVTACVWLRTDDLLNYGTVWSYAVDTSWLNTDASANAFTAYDYASLKVTQLMHLSGGQAFYMYIVW